MWHIVDLKTDLVAGLADLGNVLKKYVRQMRRYRHAVTSLLGSAVQTTICFRDYSNGVHREIVR